jgi:hypothetical protein
MHPLLEDSIQALDDPGFCDLFHQFLVLQRYDLTPYIHLFGTLPDHEKFRHGTLSAGTAEVSANEFVRQFIGMLRESQHPSELAALAEAFWNAFPDVVGNRGTLECVTARQALEGEYEQHFMMPLLRPQLCSLAPRHVLDFGCGLNRLASAIQKKLRGMGAVVPH